MTESHRYPVKVGSALVRFSGYARVSAEAVESATDAGTMIVRINDVISAD